MSDVPAPAPVIDFRQRAREIRARALAARAAGDRDRARALYLAAEIYETAWLGADRRARQEQLRRTTGVDA